MSTKTGEDHTTFHNFCRVHETLRATPAMEAGLSDHVWDIEEFVAIMDGPAPKPGRPKTYKPRLRVFVARGN